MMTAMSITVFGATGQIGRLVVEQSLAKGHAVTAYVRDPDKLAIDDARLVTITGELSDQTRILDAVTGADAVISALGPSLKRSTKGTPVTDGIRQIVAAMQTAHVDRFIGLATPSVPDPRDRPTLRARVMPRLAGLLFPNALNEIVGMTNTVIDSGLDWTIARITSPNNRKPKGTLRAGFLGRDEVGSAMTRSDIAAFLVAQLTDSTYSKAAPVISN